jgi:hypothetical protein
MLPVTTTCRASLESIVAAMPALLERYFLQEHAPPRTFSISFKSRNCNLPREPVLAAVCEIAKAGGRHRVSASGYGMTHHEFGVICRVLDTASSHAGPAGRFGAPGAHY